MSSTSKSFGVRFYVGVVNGAPDNVNVSSLLANEDASQKAGQAPVQFIDFGLKFELRELVGLNNGEVYRGVLAVLRDDAPNIRGADGRERPIKLDVDEHLIEKNHFLFFRQNQLLVWQVNGRGSHVCRMERFMTALTGMNHTVSFGDVLNRAALSRLENGTIKRLEVRFASPKNADAVDPNVWEKSAFDLLKGVDGTVLSLEISTRKKGKGLSATARTAIHRLMDRADVRKLAVRLERESDPVDLFADCVKDRIEVEMAGLYPVRSGIYAALQAAKDRQQAVLDEFFGVGSRVLA